MTDDINTNPPDRELWIEYERRKRELRDENLTADEYNRRIREIIDDLGI